MKPARLIGKTPRKQRFLKNLHRMRKAKGIWWPEIAAAAQVNPLWLSRVASRGLEDVSPVWGNVEAVQKLATYFEIEPGEFWADPFDHDLRELAERLKVVAEASGVTIDHALQRLGDMLALPITDEQSEEFKAAARSHPRRKEISRLMSNSDIRLRLRSDFRAGYTYAEAIERMLPVLPASAAQPASEPPSAPPPAPPPAAPPPPEPTIHQLIMQHERGAEIDAAINDNPKLWKPFWASTKTLPPPARLKLILIKLDQDKHEQERDEAEGMVPIGKRRK